MEVHDVIAKEMAKRAMVLVGEIISNPSVDAGVFLPLRLSRNANGKQNPSHRDLANLRDDLGAVGISVEFLLVDREAESIEEGLRASAISSFPDSVRNVFVTTSAAHASVWIDSKREPSQNDIEKIKRHLDVYIKLSSISSYKIHFISEESLATNTEFLSIIRNLAPASCEGVRDALLGRGFSVPSLDWINRRFDALRKAGMVVRLPNRSYVLTSEALHRLGTLKNRHSPDVSRLLALARRGG